MWQLCSNYLQKILVFLMILLGSCFLSEEYKADEFSNAYDFFENHGTDMVFQVGGEAEGVIYYGTKGPKAATATARYGTVGWKITVKNASGATMETLYFALGGEYLEAIDSQIIDGYEYMLYACTLPKLISAMSENAKNALQTANCQILFDACMIVKINGEPQGGMEDGGETWGTVYTTYDGIVNAKNWTDSSKENLRSYFNKVVTGLFYRVKLSCGTGIEGVSGEGEYCYGTTVTIDALAKQGYTFSHWSGDKTAISQSYSFVIYDSDISMTANAVLSTVDVYYHRNWSKADVEKRTKTYTYEDIGTSFWNSGWTREGYWLRGWSILREDAEAMYDINENITQNWLDTYVPSVNLYAVWVENNYLIAFEGNGGVGNIENELVSYAETMGLPRGGFMKEGASQIGWSIYAGSTYAEYACGEDISISQIVELLGLGAQDGATITFYAIWDYYPTLEGEDIYVSLEEAKKGKITEEWLSTKVRATDLEDGVISYGIHGENKFYLWDYSATDFTSFRKGGYVTETFRVVDSAGNSRKLRIKVYIIESRLYDETVFWGVPRFISKKYYKTEVGGLWEDSVWRLNMEYKKILDSLFEE